MKTAKVSAKLYSLLLALVLVTAYVIPVNAVQYAQDQESHWYDSIPEMLAAGEYEEGVVIAGIDMSGANRPDDPGSALETKKLRADTEEIISVDTEAALSEEEFDSWLREHKGKLAEQNEGICITSIRRGDMTTAQILKLLASDDSIVFAEPNYVINVASGNNGTDADNTEKQSNEPESSGPVPDASSLQWSSSDKVTYRGPGSPGNVSMNVPGWPDGSNMDHEIIVAVMDMAVDFSNPDLKDRAYTFSPGLMNKLGCDVHGFNCTWGSEDGKLQYFDDADHGTHVAGIIGASWDGKGISGVGSDVRIVSVQNIAENGYSSVIDTLKGMSFIKEAKRNGVDIRIVNNSWGQTQNTKAIDAAVTELGKNGIISMFAASNDGTNLNTLPNIASTLAENPYAILVASSDPTGNLADSSCYGKGIVTLAAPGASVLSTLKDNKYIPSMAGSNTFYEGFENGSADLKICQVDPETGKKVAGTEGVIVSGGNDMGFEGNSVIKVPVDKKHTGDNYGAPVCLFRMEFSDAAVLQNKNDTCAFAFGGTNEITITEVSGYDGWPFGLWANRGCWNLCEVPLEEITAGEEPYLDITMEVADVNEVYFDTIGIGSEKHPYGIMSGTSMACPAASGAAAVLASRHYDELTAGDSDAAKKLAGYVRSSVRPMPAMEDKVSTGGMIDLSVSEAASVPAGSPAPDITDASVAGKEVELTGRGFGSSGGSAVIKKYVAGQESAEVESKVNRWSDSSVTLSLSRDFEGIIEAELTAANGKKDTFVKFINKSSNVFETDHSLRADTGEPFVFDEPDESDPDVMGDLESTGIMMPLGGRIYYMPVACKVEKTPAYRNLCCYDPATDSWSSCPDYPEWITVVSGTAFDGKLYVKGTAMQVYENEERGSIPFAKSEDERVCVYSYTPGDSGWKECSSEGVLQELTLFSTDMNLRLAGTTAIEADDDWLIYNSIREYEPDKGAGDSVVDLPEPFENPIVVFAFGRICISQNYRSPLFILSEDMSEKDVTKVELPFEYYKEGRLQPDNQFSLAGNKAVLMYTGPVDDNGSTETCILRAGETAFSPYEKRVSDSRLSGRTSVIMDKRLYTIGGADFEPGRRVFRSTLLNEFPVSIDGAKVVLSKTKLTYNGKVRKPAIKLIKGMALKEGTDYTVRWSDSGSKNVGSYTVAITGKGDFSGTTGAAYKIVPKGTGIKKLKKGKKSVTVSWKKQSAKMSKSRITGYQIQLAANKKFTKNSRTVTVKGYKKVSRKITGLKAKKKYYVRIRTYKTVKGVKYYSAWSRVRAVKTR